MYVSIDMRIAEAFANIEYCVIELSRGNPKVTIVLDHMTSMKYLRLMGAPIIAPIRTSVRIRKLDLLHYVALGQLDLSLLNVDEVDISVDALRNITLPTNLDTLSIQGTASVRDFHFNMLKFDQTQPLAAVLCLENVNFVHYGRYAATVDPVNYGIIMQVNIDKCTGDINFIGDTHVRYIE